MKNGVAAFQRTISQFIKEENLSNTYAYLNNVTVAGSTQLEHDRNVKAFIDAIRRRNFTLNENKTISSVSDIKILGYVVGNKCIKPDPERMKPLLNLPPPDNFKALRRVLGMFCVSVSITKKEAFITFKDHKTNFINNPKSRLFRS